MNYLKIYCNLIRKAENRTPPEGYTEKHHTFPKSIFGKNNRIVVLTAREHYIAHALLEKICIKRYGPNHIYTEKMIYAHFLMNDGKRYFNSLLYERVRKKVSIIHSKRMSGKNNPRYGKIGIYKHSEETKEKQRRYNIENNKKPPINGGWNKGKKHSEETKEKQRQYRLGKKATENTRKKLREKRKNNKWWTDGISNKLCKECPGDGWVNGRLNKNIRKKLKWWNDGCGNNKMSEECPGPNWTSGMSKESRQKMSEMKKKNIKNND